MDNRNNIYNINNVDKFEIHIHNHPYKPEVEPTKKKNWVDLVIATITGAFSALASFVGK
ncbi:hypothetical protein [Pedobacter miscanthi]|uniref:hypothetical protein n=1 Tax=Pedobacter miscanthi TaxID=2259170 RepID=UPI00292FCC8F|nr:hypothetical protein [Pedobacter miscanthi]